MQHVHTDFSRATADGNQTEVIRVKGQERNGELPEVELQDAGQGVDVFYLRQVCTHLCTNISVHARVHVERERNRHK